MNLPTDTELEKAADRITVEWAKSRMVSYVEFVAYMRATIAALKVERESLKYMQHKDHCALFDRRAVVLINPVVRGCDCGLDQHLALLRDRLGIKE